MKLIIQKYGGTSLGSIERIKFIAHYIKNNLIDNKLVIVVSAMAGHTNELNNMALNLSKTPQRRELDMLLTVGERVSMALLSIALHEIGVPSISLTGSQCGILTDEIHGNARIKKIIGDRILEGLEKYSLVIVAGFQGVNPISKEITTLGRGGSDLTAIAIAKTLNADLCEIYTDVKGVYTCDPNLISKAKIIPVMTWHQMTELSWAGAKVIHPRAACLAQKYKIPYWIKSSFDIKNQGTLIKGENKMEEIIIKSITYKKSLNLMKFNISENLKIITKALDWLWQNGESPYINQYSFKNNQAELTQTIGTSLAKKYADKLHKFANDLNSSCTLIHNIEDICTITLIGENLRQSPQKIDEILSLVNNKIFLIELKNSTLTICIKENHLTQTLESLHKILSL